MPCSEGLDGHKNNRVVPAAQGTMLIPRSRHAANVIVGMVRSALTQHGLVVGADDFVRPVVLEPDGPRAWKWSPGIQRCDRGYCATAYRSELRSLSAVPHPLSACLLNYSSLSPCVQRYPLPLALVSPTLPGSVISVCIRSSCLHLNASSICRSVYMPLGSRNRFR